MTRGQWILVGAIAVAAVAVVGRRTIVLQAGKLVGTPITVVMPRDLIAPNVISEFEHFSGSPITVVTYSNMEALEAMMEGTVFHCDLLVVPPYGAHHLLEIGKFRALSRSQIPNLQYVDKAEYPISFDKNYNFIIPYEWGSLGIAYNRNQVAGIPKSWADLFLHYDKTRTKGGLAVMDLARYMMGTVLVYMKHSPNTEDFKEIDAAGDLLMKLKDQITYVDAGNSIDDVQAGKVAMAVAWAPDVAKAMAQDKTLRLSLPSEGSLIFRLCFAVPKSAENPEVAESLINFLLEPQVAAEVTNYSFNPTTVRAANPFIDRFIMNGPAYFRNPNGKDYYIEDVSVAANAEYIRQWKRLATLYGRRDPPGTPDVPDKPVAGGIH